MYLLCEPVDLQIAPQTIKAPKFLPPLRISCSFPVLVRQVKGKNILHKEKDHLLLSYGSGSKEKNFLFCYFMLDIFVLSCN